MSEGKDMFSFPTAVKIILFTLCSLLLLGCRQEAVVVETETAVPIQPTPTLTPDPTLMMTETAVAVPTETIEPTAVVMTPEPTATSTPLPEPTPIQPLVTGDVPYDPEQTYMLQVPDAQSLANLFHDWALTRSYATQFDVFFINEDIQRHYPSGLPELIPIMTDPSFVHSFRDSHDEVSQSFDFNYDLTGDGVNDIIEVGNYGNGRGAYWESRIYAWDGERIVLLERLDFPVFYGRPDIEVRDSNGDGIHDVYMPIARHNEAFDCDWSETIIYTWPDGQAQHEYINHEAPDTAQCNLWRIIDFPPMSSAERIELLTHTLTLPEMQNPTTWDTNFKALVLIHLGMAYAAENDFEQATAVLDQLLTLPADSEIVQAIQEIYAAEQERPLAFCHQLIKSSEQFKGNFGQLFSYGTVYGRSSGAYDEDDLYLPAICHFSISQLTLPGDEPPGDTLRNLGIVYKDAQTVNLDDDSELEWVGILKEERNHLVIFELVDGFWHLGDMLPAYAGEGFLAVTLVEKDVTGDGEDDVLALLTQNIHCPNEDSPQPKQQIFMLETKDESANFQPSVSACDDVSFAPEDIDPSYFNRIEREPTWKQLGRLITLNTAVSQQTDPDIPNQITQLLNYLPTDDPEAEPFREHLTYLLGYHYELSGDAETAVATYLDLIQQAPSSPWSWLAWARLEAETNR